MEIYTTLGYIVSLILLNLGHVFRFRIISRMCQYGWRCESETCVPSSRLVKQYNQELCISSKATPNNENWREWIKNLIRFKARCTESSGHCNFAVINNIVTTQLTFVCYVFVASISRRAKLHLCRIRTRVVPSMNAVTTQGDTRVGTKKG